MKSINDLPEIYTTDVQGIEKLFADLVFKMLFEEGMIAEELAENMRSWKHSGFSVHCGKPIKACDADGRKTLSEYISRAPFSLERMSFNEDSKTVVYKGEHFHPLLPGTSTFLILLPQHSCMGGKHSLLPDRNIH
jgi:hypothetical protein